MKKRLLLLLCAATLILTGCWDSIELNDIAIVTGMAIDPGKEKKYQLTVGYVNPAQYSKQNPAQGAPVSIMTLEGNSLPEISAKMNVGVSRRLVFSHTRALYINEKVAKSDGVSHFLDSLERSPQFRNDFNILVTKNHSAGDFAMINDPVERVPSLKVQKSIKSLLKSWGGDPRVRLTDFIDAIIAEGRSPVASTVVIEGDPEKGQNAESNMEVKAPARIMLDGLAVFKKDKLIGYLSLDDTRNYLWTQKLESTMISIPCEEDGDDEKPLYFDIVITNNKSEMRTDYKGNQPQLKLNIFSEARINSMQCQKDLSSKEIYTELEKKSDKQIKNMITETIKKVQKDYGVDIFGFGEALNRQHYQKAKKVLGYWNEEFSRADVDVNVKIALRRSGTRNKSFISELSKKDVED